MNKPYLFLLALVLCAFVGRSPAAPADTGYRERVQTLFAWADTVDMENFLVAAARIRNDKNPDAGFKLFVRALQRSDNSHRGMFVIYEMMTAYLAVQDRLPQTLKNQVRDYLATANFYRGDTENHWVMYYTGLYLAAESFPDMPAEKWYTGKSSAENLHEAAGWLHHWMELTTTIGQGEFDSPTYMSVFFGPMFGLYLGAADPVMQARARVMVHWLIADYAVEHLDGIYVGAHSRDYPERIIMPKHKHSEMTGWGWLLFGKTAPFFLATTLSAALSDFDLPEILYQIGTDRNRPYVHTETKRVRNIIRFGDQRNPPVYKYTYMTKDFALGSMQGGGILQPIQQHVWDISFVTSSPYARIFTVHPYVGERELAMFFPEEMKFVLDEVTRFHTYYGRDTKWVSSSPFEQTFQHRNAIIVLYNIPPGTQFGHLDGFFPRDLAAREDDPSGWIFCQAGNCYVAYFPLQPYRWIEEVDCFRLRSDARQNGCVVEVAPIGDYPSFAAFKKQIRRNMLTHDTFATTLTVSYTTSAGEAMTFTYDGARQLDGRSIDFLDYKLFRGPYVNAEVGSRKMTLSYKQEGIVLDMATQEAGQILPEYICKKISGDLQLTGRMDDPRWQEAAPAPLLDAVSGQAGRFATQARVLYNDRYLYVGFHCDDDYVWGSVTERNGPIYDEECVEVFVNPAGASHQYYEINLSPKNVIFDACLINERTPEKPDGSFIGFPQLDFVDLHTKTHIDGQSDVPGKGRGWTAELAIPIKELFGAPHIPPQPGDVWRINFYRIDSPVKEQREHYAWSQTGRPAFHLPWKFGYLRFGN